VKRSSTETGSAAAAAAATAFDLGGISGGLRPCSPTAKGGSSCGGRLVRRCDGRWGLAAVWICERESCLSVPGEGGVSGRIGLQWLVHLGWSRRELWPNLSWPTVKFDLV
jgi:hypothetical protein